MFDLPRRDASRRGRGELRVGMLAPPQRNDENSQRFQPRIAERGRRLDPEQQPLQSRQAASPLHKRHPIALSDADHHKFERGKERGSRNGFNKRELGRRAPFIPRTLIGNGDPGFDQGAEGRHLSADPGPFRLGGT